MKRISLFLIFAVAVYFLTTAFTSSVNPAVEVAGNSDEFVIPEDISALLDKSCFGCHNTESESDKAKKKLLLDELSSLSQAKLVGKLGEISEVLKENEMPPEKFLTKYPDKKLTEEEAKKLIEWADATADAMLK